MTEERYFNLNRMATVVQFCRENPEGHDQKIWVDTQPAELEGLANVAPRGEEFGNRDVFGRNELVLTSSPQHSDDLISCGTTACFAGWTVLLNPGDKLLIGRHGDAEMVRTGDGTVMSVEDRAAELLGLNDVEATHVFCDTENLDEVVEALEEITGYQF